MNWGLSNKLKYDTIKVNPFERPKIKDIFYPNWFAVLLQPKYKKKKIFFLNYTQ